MHLAFFRFAAGKTVSPVAHDEKLSKFIVDAAVIERLALSVGELRGQRAQRVGVSRVLQVVKVPGQVITAGERDDCAGEQARRVEAGSTAAVPPFASHGGVGAVVSDERRLCRCGETGRLCGTVRDSWVDSACKQGR